MSRRSSEVLVTLGRRYVREAPGVVGKAALAGRWLNPRLRDVPRRRVVEARFGARFAVDTQDLIQRPWRPSLSLRETRPRSGSAWTVTGSPHDQRGLKHRPRKAVRNVPIPPDLVALLRWHITAYGVAPDGRLFRTQRSGLIQDTGYGEVWAEARNRALSPTQQASRLAKRPYDLRHAAVSTWLSSGVEPQVAAQRAGHSVAVLFRVYAKCLDGAAASANARIKETLRNAR